ncbi:hypothetical protein HDK77DRAFT_208017 [Phyllosticta capitalensis]
MVLPTLSSCSRGLRQFSPRKKKKKKGGTTASCGLFANLLFLSVGTASLQSLDRNRMPITLPCGTMELRRNPCKRPFPARDLRRARFGTCWSRRAIQPCPICQPERFSGFLKAICQDLLPLAALSVALDTAVRRYAPTKLPTAPQRQDFDSGCSDASWSVAWPGMKTVDKHWKRCDLDPLERHLQETLPLNCGTAIPNSTACSIQAVIFPHALFSRLKSPLH